MVQEAISEDFAHQLSREIRALVAWTSSSQNKLEGPKVRDEIATVNCVHVCAEYCMYSVFH